MKWRLPIVPTGELDGRQDLLIARSSSAIIVPTGELDGRQDPEGKGKTKKSIVPTGELDGRQDLASASPFPLAHCTNWGIGWPARLVGNLNRERGHCTNWGIGWPARLGVQRGQGQDLLYQLGNWMAGKTRRNSL